MIENTQDPGSILATTLLALATGDTDAVIRAQERAGKAQLVLSDRLPTDFKGDDPAVFEALGFTFGEPDPADPLFRPASLPDGWSKTGSDHEMWSYVLDQLGRRRVAVFYKAAFYDRRAFMRLNTVYGYVTECVHRGADIITDTEWATPTAVAAELRRAAAQKQESVDLWSNRASRDDADDDAKKYLAEFTAERDKYAALAERYEKAAEA
ncbi:hypothetical protein WB388_08870 [Streptomyces brasiliscabiei]|uniref:Uncharacterized protein n=1 Tax=Streptomyces brasiliscabiei TaxID=2736302 RepID=A0ABU8G9W5_9ACTN